MVAACEVRPDELLPSTQVFVGKSGQGKAGGEGRPAACATEPEQRPSCHAHTREDGVGVGWCDFGNGTWVVRGYRANAVGVNGPYGGSAGYRNSGKEQTPILN